MDELGWSHKVSDIQERRTFTRRAEASECAVVTDIFGDAVCHAMSATYDIDPLGPGRYRVSGRVVAEVEQICGVTLDPVLQDIAEDFDVEFRSGTRREVDMEPEFDAFGDDEPEPIENGEIRIGRFVCEIVASALDPFPRAADAELEKAEAGGEAVPGNPFAALAKLKGDGATD